MALKTLAPTASQAEILAAMEADGAAIIRDLINPEVVQQMTDEVMPFIQATPMGLDDFTGRQTQRTGASVSLHI